MSVLAHIPAKLLLKVFAQASSLASDTNSSSTKSDASPLLLGDTSSLLQYIMLAIGAALLVGNVMALVRPPSNKTQEEIDQLPRRRIMAMAVLGGVIAAWAGASLIF